MLINERKCAINYIQYISYWRLYLNVQKMSVPHLSVLFITSKNIGIKAFNSASKTLRVKVVRVATVREKYLKNEFVSRSGKSQGNLKRIWKSGNLKINSYGRQSSENLFILFKRGNDVLSHEIVLAHLPPQWGLLKKERICSLWEQILSFKSNPKFEVILLAPLK